MLWLPKDVKQEPTIYINNWSVLECTLGNEVHNRLVGVESAGLTGRASSSLVYLDAESMMAKTRSGRLYSLGEDVGLKGEAGYMYEVLVRTYDTVKDVTSEWYKPSSTK